MYAIYQNKVFIEKKMYIQYILHDFLRCCRNLSCCRKKRKDLVPLKYKVLINVMLLYEIFVIFFNMEFTYIEYFIECLQT